VLFFKDRLKCFTSEKATFFVQFWKHQIFELLFFFQLKINLLFYKAKKVLKVSDESESKPIPGLIRM